MHPLLKPYNLFYSNGVAILSCFHDIPQYQDCRGEKWPVGGHFEFYRLEIFQDASSFQKAQLGTLEYETCMCNMIVIGQYFSRSAPETNCASKRLNKHSSETKVGQNSYTLKGTTRPPRGVVCKIWRQSDKYFQWYAPEMKCSRTAQRPNGPRPNAVTSSFSPLRSCVLNSD